MSEERRARKYYGMEAVCVLKDVLMVQLVNARWLLRGVSETH